MAKYCTICRQSYSVEFDSCPFCEVPALRDESRPSKPVRIDDPTPLPAHVALTVPAGLAANRGPDRPAAVSVGEAPVESSGNGEKGQVSPVGPRSGAMLLLGKSGPQSSAGAAEPRKGEDRSDAEIDLGSPVLGEKGGADSGPPSGASFVSWTALINGRKDFDDDLPGKIDPVGPASSARALLGSPTDPAGAPLSQVSRSRGRPGHFPVWFYVAAVPLGVLLAYLIKLLS